MRYVTLPGHPFYGHQVTVVGQRTYSTDQRCIIEDPSHPGFYYHIPERWLSNTPPLKTESLLVQEPVALPIPALDRMVQMILTKQQIWRAREDEQPGSERYLATDRREEQASAASEAVLAGPGTSRRNTA